MSFYNHPTSNHQDEPAQSAAPAAPAVPALVPPVQQPEAPKEPAPFTYEKTNVEPPKGAPDDVVPDAVRELREADDDRRMYSPQRTYAQVVKDDVADDEQTRMVKAESRNVLADLSMSDGEAREVVQLFNTELANGLPSDETAAAWQAEALESVVRQYGKDAPARIAAARALVARDPRVQRLLDDTKLGSNPRVVHMLIDKAQSERLQGRLK